MHHAQTIQVEWRKRRINQLVQSGRAIKPSVYEHYGIQDGKYITAESGTEVDVEAFYRRVEELVFGCALESIEILFGTKPSFDEANNIGKRLQQIDMQLMLLYQVLVGESEYGIVFDPDLLDVLLQTQDSDEFEDFTRSHDIPTPLSSEMGETYIQSMNKVYS